MNTPSPTFDFYAPNLTIPEWDPAGTHRQNPTPTPTPASSGEVFHFGKSYCSDSDYVFSFCFMTVVAWFFIVVAIIGVVSMIAWFLKRRFFHEKSCQEVMEMCGWRRRRDLEAEGDVESQVGAAAVPVSVQPVGPPFPIATARSVAMGMQIRGV
ncbi:hypothetical protein B0T16DRAFT_455543 [Cercophora newfieldiana]|uniref:Uncharacterized protein n=1 Tax=Cercophora newfieldiana TaxID=92897 RepID=A0AA40CRJ9_9PEZI|nr:hypothetical protein B0T16DRAFT_455543 [Cercophora newfieldiana]